uniref:Coenzyme Q-binding protein COQ10 START domain-containing protein n=1 Tax=Babesia bovis TaxID=5865 RepID=A7AM01_BABBO|eukprot:XP_001611153.1 hypothetical protein [Babesia bovis T2Bo]
MRFISILTYIQKSSWVDCVDLKQLSNHGGQRKATITVDFKLIKESYTSVVHFNPHDRIKAVAANNDLFEVLDTVWEFKDIGDATEVDFNIKFKFHSGMYQTITTYMGRTLSGSMVDHFVKECYRRHNLKKIPFQKEHVGI